MQPEKRKRTNEGFIETVLSCSKGRNKLLSDLNELIYFLRYRIDSTK